MKLDVDLSQLFSAVAQMGAASVDFDIGLESRALDPIDVQLADSGIAVDFSDVDFDSGLATYRGRQVLLYIPDHSFNIQAVLSGETTGNKFHIAYCQTLQDMKARGRYARYQVTNKLDGRFHVFGNDGYPRQAIEGEAGLKVCKNCLSHLNYQGYRHNKSSVFNKFSIEEFFSTYSSLFPHEPAGFGPSARGYTYNWNSVSSDYKASIGYVCEYCQVSLEEHKNLLHVHHLNGVKSDNNAQNLRALCLDCHKKQPMHGHMFVKHEDVAQINALRREQGCSAIRSWSDVEKYADQALSGTINLCKKYHLRLPEVGYDLGGGCYLDLAWPAAGVAVVLSERDRKTAVQHNWKIWSMIKSLEEFMNFSSYVR